jgi:hypothetical protein
MGVDIASTTHSNGVSAVISGDSIAAQGPYVVPPHASVIQEAITTAHPTNPRIDRVVLEVKDNTVDAGGSNLVQTRVIAGTPSSGATLANLTGVAALPDSAITLAYVFVGATVTSIANAVIQDARPKRRGATAIATAETRTNTVYGLMTTPDVVRSVVLPADGLLLIAYQAQWQESVLSAARAGIFIGANQVRQATVTTNLPEDALLGGTTPAKYMSLWSTNFGLASTPTTGSDYLGDVTTGQAIGGVTTGTTRIGGFCVVFAAAGTYDVSVQYKSSSGTVTAKERKLWVQSIDFGKGVMG